MGCWERAVAKPLFPALAAQWGLTATAPASQPSEPGNKARSSFGPVRQCPRTPAAKLTPTDPTSAVRNTHPTALVTTVTFDILRVRVPQGLLSKSGKVWNHVETGFLPANMTTVLHRNGLRIARGSVDAWPPIKAIFDTEPRVETSQNRLTLNNGLPLVLELDPLPRDQLLFVYRRDGSLAGAPWRSSRNLLRIDYGVSPNRVEALLLEVVPAIRLDSLAANKPRAADLWDRDAALADHSLAIKDLAFRVELAPAQFLAIGPSSATLELPYVMGSLLLCEDKGGEKFESMYFITPTATRNGGR